MSETLRVRPDLVSVYSELQCGQAAFRDYLLNGQIPNDADHGNFVTALGIRTHALRAGYTQLATGPYLQGVRQPLQAQPKLFLLDEDGHALGPAVPTLLSKILPTTIPDISHEWLSIREGILDQMAGLTKLKPRLARLGCDWFNLDDWRYNRALEETRFKLQPMDRMSAKPGWYTVNELLWWTAGHGPIPYVSTPL